MADITSANPADSQQTRFAPGVSAPGLSRAAAEMQPLNCTQTSFPDMSSQVGGREQTPSTSLAWQARSIAAKGRQEQRQATVLAQAACCDQQAAASLPGQAQMPTLDPQACPTRRRLRH